MRLNQLYNNVECFHIVFYLEYHFNLIQQENEGSTIAYQNTHNRYELSWVHILNLLGGMFNLFVPVTPRTCYGYKDSLYFINYKQKFIFYGKK